MKRRLSDSKYITTNDGQLGVVDGLGPICDVHTHLALTYVPSGDIDLYAKEVARLYLDPERAHDFDVYMNRNFEPDEMRRMKIDFSLGSLRRGGMRGTHTAKALVNHMRLCGVERSVILAIDLPHSTANTDSYVTVARDHAELVPAAAIHPLARDAESLLRSAVARGARALKMHPAVQLMEPDHPKAMRLYEVAGELGIPVVWHCGPVGIVSERADARCQLKNYWRPIHDLPNTTFVLGHSGALQYEMGIKLAQMYDNVYLEIASQGAMGLDQILKSAPTDRIMNGSDFPFYHQGFSVVKILEATEHDEALRRRLLWDNAARLFDFEEPIKA